MEAVTIMAVSQFVKVMKMEKRLEEQRAILSKLVTHIPLDDLPEYAKHTQKAIDLEAEKEEK